MRGSGILLPVFSLPGNHGIGCFSKAAYEFLDFLKDAGQKYWQILPIGPIGEGNSPYQSFSTFAIEPLFIDVTDLINMGLLEKGSCDLLCDLSYDYVDYDALREKKYPLLRTAYDNFLEKNDFKDFEAFSEKEAFWLDVYSEFMAKTDGDKGFHKFLQFIAFTQWMSVKEYANSNGIKIVGDIPIYVSPVGADILQNPKLFQLSEAGEIENVAGCPPDGFAPKGQIWNNPLYNWEYHKDTDYAWWKLRMKKAFELFDIVRIDHFRGFDEYFSIPSGDEDAFRGKWVKGPGIDVFYSLEKSLGKMPVIAEDLGFITESVRDMQVKSGYPGMKIIQFAFDGNPNNEHLPDNYDTNFVVYTGTHDNQTILGFVKTLDDYHRKLVYEYLGFLEDTDDETLAKGLINIALKSKAETCIIPLQDYLMLDDGARINKPSTKDNSNWSWRIKKKALDKALSDKILKETKDSERYSL